MLPQTTLPKPDRPYPVLTRTQTGLVPVAAALALGIVVLCGMFLPEIRAAIEIWSTSTAYGHCFLILPMTLYLLHDRREIVAACRPRPELWWAALGIPVGAVWLVAERLGIMEGRQLMAVAAIQVLFLAVLGWRVYWNLSGPLLYLFFLVPFGAFVTPALQNFTAEFSVVGLDLLGIPNYADNFVIETPAGIFFVAEACAGLRFLIAAIAFGVFYALLNFRSPWRRLSFMLASIGVPIIANGFRALGIVVLGQILGSAEAAAADHVIYGWVFFSIVMLLLVAAGHPFRQAIVVRNAVAMAASAARPRWAPIAGALLTLVLVGAGPAVAVMIDARWTPATLAAVPSWQAAPGCAAPTGVERTGPAIRFAVRCGEQSYDVQIAAFPARSTAGALVVERRRITEELGAEDVSAAPIGGIDDDRGLWTSVQTTDPNRLTAFATWVDGLPVSSGVAQRLAQARDSVLGASHFPVLLTITSKLPARIGPQQRRAVLDQLKAIIEAQAGLSKAIADLSRVP